MGFMINRTVVEMAMCLLYKMKQSNTLLAEAVNTLIYLLNKMYTRVVIGYTPIEA